MQQEGKQTKNCSNKFYEWARQDDEELRYYSHKFYQRAETMLKVEGWRASTPIKFF